MRMIKTELEGEYTLKKLTIYSAVVTGFMTYSTPVLPW